MQDAAVSRPDKSLVLAGAPGNSGLPTAAKQMRGLFGPRGSAARQDVLVAADIDVLSGEIADFEAWAAYCKTKKKGGGEKRSDGDVRRSENEVNDHGQTLNGRRVPSAAEISIGWRPPK